MVTNRDLQMEYTRDTGNKTEINQRSFYTENDVDYTRWLEEQLLFIRNAFGIDAILMEKLKKIEKDGLR